MKFVITVVISICRRCVCVFSLNENLQTSDESMEVLQNISCSLTGFKVSQHLLIVSEAF